MDISDGEVGLDENRLINSSWFLFIFIFFTLCIQSIDDMDTPISLLGSYSSGKDLCDIDVPLGYYCE